MISRLLSVTAISLMLLTDHAASQDEEGYQEGSLSVSGWGREGDYFGTVESDGRYVTGTLTNEYSDEVWFEGQFTSEGRIEDWESDYSDHVILEVN